MYSTTYVTTGLQMYLLLVSRQIPIPPLVARTVVISSFSFLHLCAPLHATRSSLCTFDQHFPGHTLRLGSYCVFLKKASGYFYNLKQALGRRSLDHLEVSVREGLSADGYVLRVTQVTLSGHVGRTGMRPAPAMHQAPLLTVAFSQAACHLTAIPPVH